MSEVAWRKVPSFPDYEVSEKGDVRRRTKAVTRPDGYVLKGCTSGKYRTYKLSRAGCKRLALAHRLVAEAFLGPPPSASHIVCHKDDDGHNNRVSNLYWGTHKDNHDDRRRNGKSFAGARNGRAKLTSKDVAEIRSSYTGRYGQVAQLARTYSVSHSQMWEITHGKSW